MNYFKLGSLVLIGALITLGGPTPGYTQDTVWNLNRCIEHAISHNLSVNRTALNQQAAKMTLELSKVALLPYLSLNSSYGRNYGRSINPTTNQFENKSYDFTGLNASGSILVFGWFQKQETIKRDQLIYQASLSEQNQLENDLSLNIATAYLRILLAQEQIQISEDKMKLSKEQLRQTGLFVEAGKSNGQDLAQVRTQLSQDSATYFKSQLGYQLAVIDMKALLNLNFEADFTLEVLPTTEGSLSELAIKPEEIFAMAEDHFEVIKSNELKVKAANKSVKIARSKLYPQISISGASGTNYSSTYSEYLPNGESKPMPWGKQVRNNLSHSFSLGISIPIFSGFSDRYAVKQAGIELRVMQYQDQEARLKLKQDVYKAYNEAKSSLQTYYAAQSTEHSATLAFEFATKRYEKGLISAIDLLIAQNQANTAKISVSASKYDMIFKLMTINYYLGRGL